MFKRPLFALVVFFCVTSLFFCGDYVFAEGYVSRDAYVSTGAADARILIPIFADDSASSSICSLIYTGLVKVDKNLEIEGDLAERWEVSPDGLAITFFLRRDVRWHDGTPFTARDVKFTYETMLDPASGCPYVSSYSDINKIETPNEYTIKFHYKKPYAPALLKFGMGIIPSHMYSEAKNIRDEAVGKDPVGTGPYIFSEWKRAEYIALIANQDFYEHPPGIKRYIYKIVPDESVQFLELVSESSDAMNLTPYQYFYRSDTQRFKSKINKYSYLAHSYSYIGYNMKDPLFRDKRVRQALSYAINREKIIDAVLLGLGEECTGPFLKDTPFYDETAPGYDYDPAKAKALFKEAGWVDADRDGVLEKNGKKFSIRISTNQGARIREDVAVIVQDQWAKVGVKVRVQTVAWAAFLDAFVNKKNFQAVILGWTIPIDPDLFSVWHSDSIGENGLNFISYSNKKVDKLIVAGRREFDQEKRREIYRKIHNHLAEDAPYTFLFFPYALPAVNKRFKGIEPAPAGISYNFIDWYVPESEVKYKF
ncbi:MAG: peptide-binding protein [Candidatus Omnitrophica bacterium]|nr:peptide-binding protein [Candidatus Omnitrophota bacterium]